MEFHIISDSCCDMPLDLKNSNNIFIVPMSIRMNQSMLADDELLDMGKFLQQMGKVSRITSSPPSPASYLGKIRNDATNFIVTLSNKVSDSFVNALEAKRLACKCKVDVHVFDSMSASAGQMLVTLKLKELVSAGYDKTRIISEMNEFIQNVRTFYVSQNLSHLIKSGRLNRLKGRLLNELGTRPILGFDGNGDIALYTYAHSDDQTLNKLIDLIKSSSKTAIENIVITHCNNFDLALRLCGKLEHTVDFKRIIVAQTRGLNSMYANDQGLIMAF